MIELITESLLYYGMIAVCFLVLITLLFLLWHSGLFSEIIIQTCKPYLGEITVAYKFARGPYKESGHLFTEAHTLLPQYRTIGVFYDNPKKKEPSRLRYIVGLIVSEDGKIINSDEKQLLEKHGFTFVTFPKINHAVQTTFPFNSTISIIVGIFRVYPLLDEYIESRSLCVHPFLEVYDCEKSKIFFIGPLEKQDDFYVPEIQADEEENLVTEGEEQSLREDSTSFISPELNDDNRHSSTTESSFEEIDGKEDQAD